MPRRRHNRQRNLLSIALETRPQSNYSRLVFPWDELSESFAKHEFNPVHTQDRLSEEDIDRVLNSLKNSKFYIPAKSKWAYCAIFLCFALFFLYVIILTMIASRSNSNKDDQNRRRDNDEEEGIGGPGLVFLLLGFFVFLTSIFCISAKIKKEFMESLRKRKMDFESVLKDFNQNEFKAKDVEWKVGNYGAWITLELNYKLRQNMMMNGLNVANNGTVGSGLPILDAHVNKGGVPLLKTQGKV